MPTIDLTELLPAEQRLLDAAIAGEPCDLINPDARPTHDEIVTWNDHKREIRAEWDCKNNGVTLKGDAPP
ncbi:hypothetical protein [Rhodococcus pyridinivorans]|uniref:Uncharacterized protein n=1 Tax=Rhodococcus pyridinivorans TaxID=103816 RepID=A0A7M2XVQ1_9NOCA|nr:hypothetical protein [Rhodococcus pyridinivorans]QOW01846.1 hypothetical protein INP59_27190 [Rhodococcus pyridinivorans]